MRPKPLKINPQTWLSTELLGTFQVKPVAGVHPDAFREDHQQTARFQQQRCVPTMSTMLMMMTVTMIHMMMVDSLSFFYSLCSLLVAGCGC